jgi:hypothetical protein
MQFMESHKKWGPTLKFLDGNSLYLPLLTLVSITFKKTEGSPFWDKEYLRKKLSFFFSLVVGRRSTRVVRGATRCMCT